MPENGYIALNIPLTPSRVGTCSTRTTHPYFLHTVRELTGLLGMTNPIENPLAGRTKGEVLALCQDQTMLRAPGGRVGLLRPCVAAGDLAAPVCPQLWLLPALHHPPGRLPSRGPGQWRRLRPGLLRRRT